MKTLHLTNWSSRKLHGPGRRLTIMCVPRAWEFGDGRVPLLTPRIADFRAVSSGAIDVAEYKRRFIIGATATGPGLAMLCGTLEDPAVASYVGRPTEEHLADGDSLLCACSRAAAAAGCCHRVFCAELLAAHGWRVILDGVEMTQGGLTP